MLGSFFKLTEKTTALGRKAIVNSKPFLYGTSNSLEQTFDRFSFAWLGYAQSNQAVCLSADAFVKIYILLLNFYVTLWVADYA